MEYLIIIKQVVTGGSNLVATVLTLVRQDEQMSTVQMGDIDNDEVRELLDVEQEIITIDGFTLTNKEFKKAFKDFL